MIDENSVHEHLTQNSLSLIHSLSLLLFASNIFKTLGLVGQRKTEHVCGDIWPYHNSLVNLPREKILFCNIKKPKLAAMEGGAPFNFFFFLGGGVGGVEMVHP